MRGLRVPTPPNVQSPDSTDPQPSDSTADTAQASASSITMREKPKGKHKRTQSAPLNPDEVDSLYAGGALPTIVEGKQANPPDVVPGRQVKFHRGAAEQENGSAHDASAPALHSVDGVVSRTKSVDGTAVLATSSIDTATPRKPGGIVRRSVNKVSMTLKQPFKKNLRKLGTGFMFERSFDEVKAKVSRFPVTARALRILVTAAAAAVFFFTFLLWQQGAPGSSSLHAVSRTRGGYVYNGFKACSSAYPYRIDLNPAKKLHSLDLIGALQMADADDDGPLPTVSFSLWSNSTNKGIEQLRSKVVQLRSDYEIEIDEAWNLFEYLRGREGLQELWVEVKTTSTSPVGFFLDTRQLGNIGTYRPLIGFFIMAVTFIVLVTDLVNRMLVSIIGSFVALTVATSINGADSIKDTVLCMDVATLCFLFSSMIIVEILSQTGVFEYIVFRCMQLSGKVPIYFMILNSLACMLLSMFLPNVTTILMMGPITISMAKSMDLDPIPFVIMLSVFGEIGSCATMVSDAPTLIIANWTKSVTFLDYIKYVFPGVIFCLPAVYFCLYVTYKNRPEYVTPQDIDLDSYRVSCMIRKPERLIKVSVAYGIVLLLWFLSPVQNMDAAWVAMLGALLILLVCSHSQVAQLIERVEWDVLFFLAGIFVLMEVMSQLRFIRVVALAFQRAIEGPAAESRDISSRLAAGVSLFFWIPAIFSMFFDNSALALFFVRVLTTMEDDGLNVPLKPLAWALSFGCVLGGNFCIFGSASNALAASLSAVKGHKVSAKRFSLVAGPVAITSMLAAYVYVLIAYAGAKYYNVNNEALVMIKG